MDTSLSQPNVDLMENVRITGLNTKFSLPYLLVFRGIARCGRSPDRATVARSGDRPQPPQIIERILVGKVVTLLVPPYKRSGLGRVRDDINGAPGFVMKVVQC